MFVCADAKVLIFIWLENPYMWWAVAFQRAIYIRVSNFRP